MIHRAVKVVFRASAASIVIRMMVLSALLSRHESLVAQAPSLLAYEIERLVVLDAVR